jgi:anti-anti-sigma factor
MTAAGKKESDVEITKETIDGVVVVSPVGRVDSNTAREVEAALLPLFDDPAPVIVDFGMLNYISSAGLRVLLLAARRSKATGTPLSLAGMSKPVDEVFRISGFAKLFQIYADRAEALAAAGAG